MKNLKIGTEKNNPIKKEKIALKREDIMRDIQFLVYDFGEEVEVIVRDETIWATQKSISKLFDVGVPAISNI